MILYVAILFTGFNIFRCTKRARIHRQLVWKNHAASFDFTILPEVIKLTKETMFPGDRIPATQSRDRLLTMISHAFLQKYTLSRDPTTRELRRRGNKGDEGQSVHKDDPRREASASSRNRADMRKSNLQLTSRSACGNVVRRVCDDTGPREVRYVAQKCFSGAFRSGCSRGTRQKG